MYQDLLDKKKTLAVIGLGYVGLPIALEFAKKIKVIGFDINAERVEMMCNKIDPSQELEAADFEGCDIEFTNNLDVLRQANFFIVTDLSGLFGLRRPHDSTIWDIAVVRDVIADIVNVFGRAGDGLSISGAVWEYYRHGNVDRSQRQREMVDDRHIYE